MAATESSSDSASDVRKVLGMMGSTKTAMSWAAFLGLLLLADWLVPQLRSFLSVMLVLGPFVAVLTTLSSISRDATKPAVAPSNVKRLPTDSSYVASELLGGVFFAMSTIPFALPWVLAFFFPRECLLFFTAWAVFGAILNEVAVLVSHSAVMRGGNKPVPKSATPPPQPPPPANEATTTTATTTTTTSPERPQPTQRRKRKTTAQRLATVSNFTREDREELEEFLVSDEGLRWWSAFLGLQGTISAGGAFLALATELFLVDRDGWEPMTVFAMIMSTSMLMESFWMTYAVGGRWLHFRQRWRFFQPCRGGRQFSSLQALSWALFFVALLTGFRDVRPALVKGVERLGPDVSPWAFAMLDAYFLRPIEAVSRVLGLWLIPRGFGAVAGVLAELFMMVSLPLYRGELLTDYLEADELSPTGVSESKRPLAPTESTETAKDLDDLIHIVEKDEDATSPPPPGMSIKPSSETTDQVTERVLVEQELKASRARLKPKPLQSQFFVPLWELTADALRTAWLAPIVLTLVKPEVTLFLTGFVLAKFVHGAHVPFLPAEYTLNLPTLLVVAESAYLLSYIGDPGRTGKRRWWSLRGTWVYDELAAYWFLHIVRERELSPEDKHVFGYIPHGMFPMAASYIHNTSQWMDLFPRIDAFSLVATVTHVVPILRDVTQFNGGIEVSANSFTKALDRFKHILLVPGGQHEMLLTPDDPDTELVSTKHKGFVRLSMIAAAQNPDERVKLVPMYVFGESQMFFNAFPAPIAVQRWLVAKLRLNPAFLPIGRFNLAGVPKRVPVTIVVGNPLLVPLVDGIPTAEQVDLVHQRFYSMLRETFERNKHLCDGYESARVQFVPPLETITQTEFEKRWDKIKAQSDGPLSSLKQKKDPIPWGEIAIAVLLTHLALWGPLFLMS